MEHRPETNAVIESSNRIIDSPQPIKPSRFLNIPTSDPVQTHELVTPAVLDQVINEYQYT
ncbi:Major facilitator superfamily domain general substrate transporter [Penicillium viridicatum]|nr:Major facilitator superfamily domain general substrate transporter [Penicillium viridicatum]